MIVTIACMGLLPIRAQDKATATTTPVRMTQIRRILTLGDRAEGLSDADFPAFMYPEPYLTVG
jgi:hypothetical protein